MELNAATFAILSMFFGVLAWLIWEWLGDWGDTFDDFWEDLNWKDEVDDDEDKRTESKKK